MADCSSTLISMTTHRIHSPIILGYNIPQSCQLVIDDLVPDELEGHDAECGWEGYITPAICGCV